MRLHSSTLTLLGAGLLAAAQANVFFNYENNPVDNRLIKTATGQPLTFTYTRDRIAAPPTVVRIAVRQGSIQGKEVAVAAYTYRTRGASPEPQSNYGMVVTEKSDNSQIRVSGSITIQNATGLASTVSPGKGVPPSLFFVLTFEPTDDPPSRISRRQDSNSARFGLANQELSSDPAFGVISDDFRRANDGPSPEITGPQATNTVVITTPPTGSAIVTVDAPSASDNPIQQTSQLHSNNGLSTGAIAGIAIGAALAVLLLGTALVWFFVRRRRQNKAVKAGLGYKGGQGRSGDLVAEKEANAIVAESPRSPYSEDGPHRESTLIGGTSETAGDYQPYSDNPTATANAPPPIIAAPVARAGSSNSRSGADRPSAATHSSSAPAPPPGIGEEELPQRADTGMSGRYAHLIEENMTPEEIARLEEEERQLDVAIERARGVTTK